MEEEQQRRESETSTHLGFLESYLPKASKVQLNSRGGGQQANLVTGRDGLRIIV